MTVKIEFSPELRSQWRSLTPASLRSLGSPPAGPSRPATATRRSGTGVLALLAVGLLLGAAHATDVKLTAGGVIDPSWRGGQTGGAQPSLGLPFSKDALASTLGVTDRVRLKIYERDDLSGEYAVREDGSIMVPILGRINATGRSTLELEQAIAEKLLDTTARATNVSIEISQQRPIYVVGVVDKPGAYSYVRGMSVLQGLAVSGGFQRMAGSLALDATKENGVARQASEKLKTAVVRQARIAAEIRGGRTVEMPPRLLQIATAAEAQSLVQMERQTLEQRQNLKRAQNEMLDREIASMANVQATLQEQRQQLGARVKTMGQEVEDMRGIARRGLATRQRVQGVERDDSEARAQLSAVVAQIARTDREHIVLVGTKQARLLEQRADMDQQYQAMSEEIRALDQTIAQSTGLIRQIMGGQLGPIEQNAQPVAIYEIVRRQDDRIVTTQVDELTVLMPGDVLRVAYAETGAQRASNSTGHGPMAPEMERTSARTKR